MSAGLHKKPNGQANAAWLVLLGILVFVVLCFRHSTGEGDDYLYSHALEHSSYWTYLHQRYMDWSGRSLIDAVTLLVINHVWIWRFFNTAMVVLAVFLTRRYAELASGRSDLDHAWLLVFALPTAVLNTALWWMTGSFNYLWPLSLALLAFWPFVRPIGSQAIFLLTVPAAAYACFQEQSGLLLLFGQVVMLIKLGRHRATKPGHWLQIATSAACFGVLLAAPGSTRRALVHIGFNFPEYFNASLLDRVFSGVDLTISHLFLIGNPVALMFCVTLLALNWSAGPGAVVKAVSATPLMILLAPLVISLVWGAGHPWLLALNHALSFSKPSEDVWIGNVLLANSPVFYLHFYFYMTGAICMTCALFFAVQRQRPIMAWPAVGLFGAAGAVTAAVGLSPALYASGARIFVFLDWTLAFLTISLFTQLPRGRAKRGFSVLVCLVAMGAIANAIFLR
jgi:hypothetical protein